MTVRAGQRTAPMVAVSGTATGGEVVTVALGVGRAVDGVGVGVRVGKCVVGSGVRVGVRRGVPARDCVGVGVLELMGDGAPLRAGDKVPDGVRGAVESVLVGLADREAPSAPELDGPNSENTTQAPRPKKTAAMRIRATSCIAPPPAPLTRNPRLA
ncbi:MAG TPA: hypothetical protein VF069_28570 [Streptosporangiaceae bacterium]